MTEVDQVFSVGVAVTKASMPTPNAKAILAMLQMDMFRSPRSTELT